MASGHKPGQQGGHAGHQLRPARQHGLDWEAVATALKREGRLHLETY